MEILEKFESLIDELAANPNVNLLQNSKDENRELLPYLNNEKNFQRIFEKKGIKVPREDWQYQSLTSLVFDWDINWDNLDGKADNSYLYGGFMSLGFGSTITGPSHFWKNYNDRAEDKVNHEFLQKLNCFHKSAHGDDGTYGCFYREAGVYPCPIYFYDSGIWYEMNMSLAEYLDKMLYCKAVTLWQYFYVDTAQIVEKTGSYEPMFYDGGATFFHGPYYHLYTDYYIEGKIRTAGEALLLHMERVIRMFPRLFPGFDVSYFQERYEALKIALKKGVISKTK